MKGVDQRCGPAARQGVDESARIWEQPFAFTSRNIPDQIPGDQVLGDVDPRTAFTPAIVRVLRRLPAFEVADIFRNSIGQLTVQPRRAPALHLRCEAVVLMACAVGQIVDCRIRREHARLVDEQSGVRRWLIDVVVVIAVPVGSGPVQSGVRWRPE